MFVALRRGEVGAFSTVLRVTCAEHQLLREGTFLVLVFVLPASPTAPDSFRDSLAGDDGKAGLPVGGAKCVQTVAWFSIFIS